MKMPRVDLLLSILVALFLTVGCEEAQKKARAGEEKPAKESKSAPKGGEAGPEAKQPPAKEPTAKEAPAEKKRPEKAPRREGERRKRFEAFRKMMESFKPDQETWLIEDFEKVNRWEVENWGNPAKLSVVKGKKGNELKIELQGGDKDKTAVSAFFPLNLAGRRRLVLNVRNGTGEDIKLAFALALGREGKYLESETVTVKPGDHADLAFDLESDKFKSEATGWKHEAKLGDEKRMRRLTFLFYTKASGEVALDEIRLTKGKP